MIANADTPPPVARRLGIAPDSLRTGRPTRSGLLVTETLLFAGEGFGGAPVLRAHDKLSADILAVVPLPAAQTGHPISAVIEGRQMIIVAVGSPDLPAEFVALALPGDTGPS